MNVTTITRAELMTLEHLASADAHARWPAKAPLSASAATKLHEVLRATMGDVVIVSASGFAELEAALDEAVTMRELSGVTPRPYAYRLLDGSDELHGPFADLAHLRASLRDSGLADVDVEVGYWPAGGLRAVP